MTPKVTLSPRKRKAVHALLTAKSDTEAAQLAGVSRKTLYVWLADSDFRQALTEAEAQALDALSRMLVSLGDQAAAALRDALAPGNLPAPRLRAADIVLSRLLQLRELVDIESRIAALEAAQNGKS